MMFLFGAGERSTGDLPMIHHNISVKKEGVDASDVSPRFSHAIDVIILDTNK